MAAKARRSNGILMTLFVLVMLLFLGWKVAALREQVNAARSEEAGLAERVARQEQENRAIEAALERAEDVSYLQQLAREQLGMVSPGQKDFYDVSN